MIRQRRLLEGIGVEAAGRLQNVILQMTDRIIPVHVSAEYQRDHPDARFTTIFVGPSKAAAARGFEVTQDADEGDHYIVRCAPAEKVVALIGNDADRLRGTTYAVYDLLKPLGCGWFGPDPLWHVGPRTFLR